MRTTWVGVGKRVAMGTSVEIWPRRTAEEEKTKPDSYLST
jgi:hypothetical protein